MRFDCPVEVVLAARARLGEGPLWDPRDGTLLWVDCVRGDVHRLCPDTGADDVVVACGQPVGVAVWRRAGGLALAVRDGFALIDDEASAAGPEIVPVDADQPDHQMNDGACDRQGRFWAGTASAARRLGTSALYRLDADRQVELVLPGVSMSNGLGWSPDDRTFYYVDSPTHRVDVFAHDPDTGRLSARRPLVTVPREVGIPDGLAVDADGCVWLAIWGAAAVHRYTPEGRLDGVVTLPTRNISSCAFGGSGLSDLFITSATRGLSVAQLAEQPLAGAVFAVRPGVTGMPPNGFAG
ncbi:MAG: SMP-30/gluconolactonase/LRE family protein [Mycobacteriales bacterium]